MSRDDEVAARDGTRLAFSIHGDPAAPTRYVLAHSLGMDRSFWEPVAQRLRPSAAVLALDCRGHGASGKPPGPYRVEDFADDLAQLLEHVGWSRAIVAGASMGGCVALAFARRHAQSLAGLGLFDTTAWYGPDAVAAWEERARKALTEGLPALVSFQQTRWFGETFRREHPQTVRRCVEVFLANDPHAYAESCRMLGAADLRSGLAGVAAPTRILVGEEDYATPVAMAEALRLAVPGARLRIVPGARHLTPLEIPDAVAEELRALADS